MRSFTILLAGLITAFSLSARAASSAAHPTIRRPANTIRHSPNSGDTLFYSYVNSGKIIGQQWVWENKKNSYYYYDTFNDRGRGPSVHSHLQTNDKGIVIAAEYTGVDYFKTIVNERFYVKAGKAYWKNKFENDSTIFHNELYSDINGPTAEYALIYKMLQAAPAGGLPVLPAGSRQFKRVTSTEITRAASGGRPTSESPIRQPVGKASLSLELVSFSGFGSAPVYLWFTREGKFFGSVSDWSSLIVRGYEGQAARLYAIQKKFEGQFYTDLAHTLTEKPAAGLAIKDATLFNPESGLSSAHQTVLIRNDKIEKMGNAIELTIPQGYRVIDGTGKFLMPGLWDMHCHFSRDQGPFMLAQGVTNIRDMGNGPELLNVRRQVNADSLLGPAVTVISGLIDKAGEFAAPTGALVKSLEEALKAVDDYKKKGYDQVKLYSSIEPAWVKPLAERAHQLGMRVCGHIPYFMTASQAVDAGYDEVTHINMLLLNFFGDTIDTRSMVRFTLIGRKGYTVDVKGPAVQQFIRQLKEHHTVLDPTLSAFEDIFTDLPAHMAGRYVPIAAYLPAEIRRNAMSGSYLDSDSLIDTYARSFANMQKMVKELYENGLIVLAGTDNVILQHELELYSDAGIPNAAVLKMATYWPAKVSGKDSLLGTIAEGKIASLVLVDGNPLEHMQDIRKIYVTIKEGRLYWPKEIYKAFGWGYYY